MDIVVKKIVAMDYGPIVINFLKRVPGMCLLVFDYPSTDFFHNHLSVIYMNPFMGPTDILMKINRVYHPNGIRIIPQVCFKEGEEVDTRKDPDWSMENTEDERAVRISSRVPIHDYCYYGFYWNEYVIQFAKYLIKNYDEDGIWPDSTVFDGICLCTHCKKDYLKTPGKSIHSQHSSSDGESDQCMNRLKRNIKSFGVDKAYCTEITCISGVGSWINSVICWTFPGSHSEFLVHVAFHIRSADPDSCYCDLNYASIIVRILFYFRSIQ